MKRCCLTLASLAFWAAFLVLPPNHSLLLLNCHFTLNADAGASSELCTLVVVRAGCERRQRDARAASRLPALCEEHSRVGAALLSPRRSPRSDSSVCGSGGFWEVLAWGR